MTEQAQNAEATPRNKRRSVVGKVVSDKMEKSITVLITRLERHAKYGKYIRRHTRVHAHDEENQARLGDVVEVIQTRPLSKLKRYRFLRVVQAAPR